MAALEGNCFLCGKTLGKTAMKNHILKDHSKTEGQECRLLKIEGAYEKNYWLYVDIPVDSSLTVLDTFLRKIWLECCGHLSAFHSPDGDVGKKRKISTFNEKDQLLHEYDFGSTTETLITVLDKVYREKQRGVRLLARNIPPEYKCCECGNVAEFIHTEELYDSDNPFYCAKCVKEKDDEDFEEMLLPVTNSPRMGVCGYCGELDTFTFVPPKSDSHKEEK